VAIDSKAGGAYPPLYNEVGHMHGILKNIKSLTRERLKVWHDRSGMAAKIKIVSLAGFCITGAIGRQPRLSFFLFGALIFILIYIATFLYTNIKGAGAWVRRQNKNIGNAENMVEELIKKYERKRKK